MSLKQAAEQLRAQGRGADTELVHLTKREVAAMEGLAKAAGGKLTRNPKTGLPEAGFLDSLLPTILGAGATMFLGPMGGAAVGALTGGIQAKRKGQDVLMGAALGGVGGYGGGQLAAGLQGAGAGAAQQAAMQGAGTQAAMQSAQEAAKQAALQQAMTGPYALDLASGVMPEAVATATQSAAASAGQGVLNQAAADATNAFMQRPFYEQMGQGLQSAVQSPSSFAQSMGGKLPTGGETGVRAFMDQWTPTAKSAGLAAAPLLYETMMPQAGGGEEGGGLGGAIPRYRYSAEQTGDYYTPGQGTFERQHFTSPTFTRMAQGGVVGNTPFERLRNLDSSQVGDIGRFIQSMAGGRRGMNADNRGGGYAVGGLVSSTPNTPYKMQTGDFVVPADVVAYAGGGSTEAGQAKLAKKLGAVPIRGAGDGLSDDIPASVDGRSPARVANGEMLVKQPGKSGARKLYKAMDNIRKQAVGHSKQVRPVDLDKALA